MFKYDSLADLVATATQANEPLSKIILREQAEATESTEEALYAQMERSLEVMRESVQEGLDPDKRSASGLTGGDAYKMMRAVQENRNICGKIFGDAMTKALAVSQTNACMGRIVAYCGQLWYFAFRSADHFRKQKHS